MSPRRRRPLRPLIRALGLLGRRSPHLALAIADLAGRFTAPFRRHSPRRLRQLFPHLTAGQASRLMRDILAKELRSQVIASFDGPALAAICRFGPQLEAIERPFILATFHIGPMLAIGQLLATEEADDRHIVRAYGGELQGAREFHRGLMAVKRNGIAGVLLDPRRASMISVPFFDDHIDLARGAFALSRLSATPILPSLFVWRGREIHLVLGERIPVDGGATTEEALENERTAAAAVARWLEQYLRGSLEDLGLRVLSPLRYRP